MSKSHRELQYKKSLSTTLYLQHKTHTKRFSRLDIIPVAVIFEKGKMLYKKNQLSEALKCFEQLIENSEKNSGEFIEEAWYLAGVIKMAKNQHNQALKYFLEVYKKFPTFKNNLPFVIAICYNSIGQSEKSIRYLNIICQQSPSIDAYFYRGKILFKQQQYEKALIDFKKTIQLGNKSYKAKLFYCQSLSQTKRIQQAIQQIDVVLGQLQSLRKTGKSSEKLDPHIRKALNIKVQIFLKTKNYEKAEQILKKSYQADENDSEVLYYKAKIHEGREQFDQMVLLLNQCLNANSNKRPVTLALEDLISLSMNQKDFYEAFQYSKRAIYLKVESKKFQALSKLAEGVTFLMKKKYAQGLLLFGSINSAELITKNKQFQKLEKQQNLVNLYHNSMGYAYFCLGQFKNALDSYKKIKKVFENVEHRSHFYNIALCEGIQAYEDDKIEQSVKIFEKSTDYLMRAEPYFYIAVILLLKNFPENGDSDFFMKIIQVIDSGIKVGQNCQMFYYRGLLYFYLGMNTQALDDVDKAIQKSEDNVAKYFYLRALIFFQQRNYEQAITQFSTCLSIDQNFSDAYLERAKAKLLNDQISDAFDDLKFHPSHDQWQPLFLLHQGQYQQIIQGGISDTNILESAHFMVGNFLEAGSSGKIILAILAQNYSQVSKILNDAIEIGFPVGSLEIQDLLILKSYCYFKLNQIQQSIQTLQKAQTTLKKSGITSYCEQQQKKLLAIKVNMIMLSLISGRQKQTIEYCDALINDVYQGSIYDQLIKLRNLIKQIMREKEREGEQQDKVKTNKLNQVIQFFRQDNMLSHYFQEQKYQWLNFKFLVIFPKIKVLDIEVVPYEQPLLSFGINNIESKPQAPWIRRDQNGVIFTNVIHRFDALNLTTEDNQQNLQRSKIKQQLQLDPEVLKKLQKLTKPRQ